MRHEHRGSPHREAAFRHLGDEGTGPGERGERHERSDRERHARMGGRRHDGPGGPRGPRGRRGFDDAEPVQVSTEAIAAWLTGRLPEEWFTGVAELVVDRDEITVIGTLPVPENAPKAGTDSGKEEASAAEEGRIGRFREETRDQRVLIAREAESRYGRTIAWGAQAGGTTALFTNRSVPVMTRLRQPERHVLDTLVNAGVARSRSDALAWCVRLVGRNSDAWLGQLRDAMSHVERVREQGPGA